jgi:hypothetical protein
VVVDERLLVPDAAAAVGDGAVLPGRLPVAVGGGAAGARAVGVLAVQPAAEEPLLVPRPQRRPLCSSSSKSRSGNRMGGWSGGRSAVETRVLRRRSDWGGRTGEVGGVGLVDVDVGDVGGGAAGGDPALEEVEDELLVGGAEAEARRPAGRRGLHRRRRRRRG